MVNSNKLIQGSKFRFTVLTPYLIRLEYSPSGEFVDCPTQAVVNRVFPKCDYDYIETADRIEIITEALRLFCFPQRIQNGFTADNLFIDLRADLSDYNGRWHFGDQLNTLKGTIATLDQADGALPLDEGIVSRNGFSVLDDSSSWVESEPQRFQPREAGYQDLYFFGYLHNYRLALVDYYHLTGPAPLLPRFALGNWWSRFWAYSAQELLELMDQFDDYQIPLSVCLIDMDWHLREVDSRFGSSWTGYTWNRDLIPDPRRLLTQLHKRGLKVGLNVHPADGVRAFEEVYPQVAKQLQLNQELEQPALFDLNDPQFVDAYFNLIHKPLEKMGVDFWWLDWQQGDGNITSGLESNWNLNYLHYLYAQKNSQSALILSRYAGLGSHRFPVGFSGDTIITWESLAFQPYFTATAANIGFGWWSHDIGGHMQGYHDPELLLRWLQFGVFSPINRMHSSDNPFTQKYPWAFRQPFQSAMKEALVLRHQLIPYLYTMNVSHHEFGLPLVLPMYYSDPDSDFAYSVPNQYTFGSEMMVAPLTSKQNQETQLGQTEVWFPDGVWFDFFKGYGYSGGNKIRVLRGLSEIPVFAKAGAIIPLDHSEPFTKTSELPEIITWKIFGGASNTFVLVEDDHNSRAKTQVTLDWKSRTIKLQVEDPNHIIPAQRQHNFSFTDGKGWYKFQLLAGHTKNLPANQNKEFEVIDLYREWFNRLQNFQIGYEAKRELLTVWDKNNFTASIVALRNLAQGEVYDALFELIYINQNTKGNNG
ncbi:MAG: DUF4968 domain-containing protein [Bifidobacteriaceae bacterium]|nr:DUF4968 domain-containing protein [Bifidobacteriaceae bacterium]